MRRSLSLMPIVRPSFNRDRFIDPLGCSFKKQLAHSKELLTQFQRKLVPQFHRLLSSLITYTAASPTTSCIFVSIRQLFFFAHTTTTTILGKESSLREAIFSLQLLLLLPVCFHPTLRACPTPAAILAKLLLALLRETTT